MVIVVGIYPEPNLVYSSPLIIIPLRNGNTISSRYTSSRQINCKRPPVYYKSWSSSIQFIGSNDRSQDYPWYRVWCIKPWWRDILQRRRAKSSWRCFQWGNWSRQYYVDLQSDQTDYFGEFIHISVFQVPKLIHRILLVGCFEISRARKNHFRHSCQWPPSSISQSHYRRKNRHAGNKFQTCRDGHDS